MSPLKGNVANTGRKILYVNVFDHIKQLGRPRRQWEYNIRM